jgi:hypothetical protein
MSHTEFDFPANPAIGDTVIAPNGYTYEWDGTKWHIIPTPGGGGGGGPPTTYVNSFNTRSGAVTLTQGDITAAGGAPLMSPAFVGLPLAPTAAPGSASTQIATTAFVAQAIASGGGGSGGASFPEAPADGAVYGRDGATRTWAEVLAISGGQMEGTLLLAEDPIAADEAATKYYVDNHTVDGGNF